MTNSYTMAINLKDAEFRKKALLITAGFIAFAILLMIFLKWKLPEIEKITQDSGIEVELNLPPDPPPPPVEENDGGGGGGNPVQATGNPGVAPPEPPAPGEKDDSKDLDDNEKEETPPITKPIATNKEAKTINNKSTPDVTPKPVEVPAPPRPKAVLGKTTTGSGRGGGATENYDKAGGSGTGAGVGNGSGTGGGSGSGNGGGNGSGSGGGSGPRVTNGDRKIVRSYSFEGDLDKATVYANVNVSPEGVGTLISIAKGSTNNGAAYKQAIQRYLQNIRFDKSDHESMVTVLFNFRVN